MSKRSIDVDAARKLVDEMSDTLARLPADSSHAALRAEVEALKSMLAASGAEAPELEDKMRSVHGMFERAKSELQADGVRAGMFLSAIGRMIGLD
jgi:hypothetical protein